jgi:hypothetical protein
MIALIHRSEMCISREERVNVFGCTSQKGVTSDNDVSLAMVSAWLVQG